MPSGAAAFRRLVEVFDRLSIPYLVGGSVASSVHGIYRSTNDIDFVVQFSDRDISPLVAELGSEFYADPDMMREALRHQRSFNLIHYGNSSKFDVFPLQAVNNQNGNGTTYVASERCVEAVWTGHTL